MVSNVDVFKKTSENISNDFDFKLSLNEDRTLQFFLHYRRDILSKDT